MRSKSVDDFVKYALAVSSGILLGLSFPGFSLGYLGLVALLPLLLALQEPGTPRETVVRPRRAFGLGYLTGVVFFLILLYWIPRLPRENVTVPHLMIPALGVMVAYLSLYPALSALVAAWLARRGVPVGVGFPLVWTLLEAARGSGLFGFSWGSLAYAFTPYPHLIQFAAWTGVWGVTLWAALAAGLVHLYLSLRWVWPKLVGFVALTLWLVAPYYQGREVLAERQPQRALSVGVVQPNVGNNKWKLAVRDSVAQALMEQTASLCRKGSKNRPELVIWPETAIPARLPREPYYRLRVETLVDTTGIPLLAGFPDGVRLANGRVRFTNSAALILPGRGMVERYDKRHLVPFSEFFPLPFLNRFDFGQSNFSRGNKPGFFAAFRVPFGVLICFESIFPGQARELTKLGARFLVNITNDQWFGDSAAPAQHFSMNVIRAIENRRAVVRAANTGISGVIDPYGFVLHRTPTFVALNAVESVELEKGMTFYVRHGNWILWVVGGALAALFTVAMAKRGERRDNRAGRR